ncbi:MAG: glycosyltransferase [Coriobacteriia bacterium]|nr:glycosyltransferase [Coriobacteriia bacterium]
MKPLVSIVVPMFNEEDNAPVTLKAVADALTAEGWTYELHPVSDGSTDKTAAVLARLAASDPHIEPVAYPKNRGRGYALRQGFAAARGTYTASLDADLSYSADHAVRMVKILIERPEVDVVLGSQWMPGGTTENVPFIRAFLSRGGNVILRWAYGGQIYTSTSVCRAYRTPVLKSLDLVAEDKEIHLEILSKAIALGYTVVEMPATLAARTKGKSKFRPKRTILSHLFFSVLARPMTLFSVFGLALIVSALAVGVYLLTEFAAGTLNPERPLMTIMVLLFVAGGILFSFSLLAAQIIEQRRAMIRLHAEVKGLRQDLEGRESQADDGS